MYAKLPYGSTTNTAPIHVDSNDVDTQIAGLAHRLCRKTVLGDKKPDPRLMKRFRAFVHQWVVRHMTPLTSEPDFEEWLEGTTYNLARKAELRQLWEDMYHQPPTRKQRRKVASFIKTECYPEIKHARWINSRSDAFKVYSGPWFKKIEQQLFSLKWFIKHVPVPDRADVIRGLKKDGAKYIATDYSSFEAHFHPQFMSACEGVLYKYMLKQFPVAADIITKTIFGVNHGRTRRGVSFRTKGRRMSGDMCTSLGNGFSNLMIWAFLMQDAEWDGRVEGDDGIFAVYRGNVPEKSDYARMGFDIKLERGDDPCLMSFCGIIAADGQNIRDPKSFIAEFGWTHSCLTASPSLHRALLKSKALSAIYEMPNCPIIRSIAQHALKVCGDVRPDWRLYEDGYHNKPLINESKLPAFAPTHVTRLAFEKLYGVSVEAQIECEKRISNGVCLDFLEDIVGVHPHSIQSAARTILSQ